MKLKLGTFSPHSVRWVQSAGAIEFRFCPNRPEKEADCLRMYFGLCGIKTRSLDEIASRFEVTRERARQNRDKALGRLRSTDTLAGMNLYLG